MYVQVRSKTIYTHSTSSFYIFFAGETALKLKKTLKPKFESNGNCNNPDELVRSGSYLTLRTDTVHNGPKRDRTGHDENCTCQGCTCPDTGSEERLVFYFLFVRESVVLESKGNKGYSTALGLGWRGLGIFIRSYSCSALHRLYIFVFYKYPNVNFFAFRTKLS